MNKITELPQNLNYYPSTTLKVSGGPKMVFDISRSSAKMIPENLKGVDCVIARKGQLLYVAPDFFGDISCLELCGEENQTFKYRRVELFDNERQFLIRSYLAQKKSNSTFFEETSKRNIFDLEERLPQNLIFSWNFEQDTGKLDARRTQLIKPPHISNVSIVLLPSNIGFLTMVHRGQGNQQKG